MLNKRLNTSLVLIAILGIIIAPPARSANRALLIGVGDYQGDKADLEGPPNDIAALKKVLQQHWGFQAENIKTLVNYDASRSHILTAFTQLKNTAKADDHVFIYFSGHGTSVHDAQFALPLPYSSGALIPQDFSATGTAQQMLAQLLVGKRDIKPILLELDKSGAHTFIAFDSCYSGNTVRGIFSEQNTLRSRQMPLKLAADESFDIDSFGDDEETSFDAGVTETEVYPYSNIFFLSAANSTETAVDIGKNNLTALPTIDNKPHGAFTDSLLRALSGELRTDLNGDGLTNYSELHTAVKRFMKTREYKHEPQVLPVLAEDALLLRMRNVLGKKTFQPVQPEDGASALLTVHLRANDPVLISKLKQIPHIQLSQQNAELNLKKQANNYLLINKSGDLLGTLISPNIQQIVGRVKQEAWKKHFGQLLHQRASINIDFSLQDSLKGSTAIEGELIAFTLRSEKPVHLLLLDIDAHGSLTTLYPYFPQELKPIAANQLKYIPGENKNNWIKVQAPFGTDHLISIGFSKEPPFLKEFVGKETLSLQSDLYKKLIDYLKTGEYGYSEFDLLTVAKKADNK